MHKIPYRQIRAVFDDQTIRVYQAYSDAIADSALAAGSFVSPPFKMERMTWIKPSFLWMMYRSGWGTKPGQTRVLAVDITREGFEWALDHACLSHYEPGTYESQESLGGSQGKSLCTDTMGSGAKYRTDEARISLNSDRSLGRSYSEVCSQLDCEHNKSNALCEADPYAHNASRLN